MKFDENKIAALRCEVCKRLSKNRFDHTIGVEEMAVKIGEKCLPDMIDKLRVAALLHDISKEYSEAEHFELINKHNITVTEYERRSAALWHSITAPCVVMDEFSDYADSDIISAVKNHTVGSPDMSVFDEIICLADYIEYGRRYQVCIDLREKFLGELYAAHSSEEAILALHRANVIALENTMEDLISRGMEVHENSILTREAILAKLERQ